MDEISGVPGKLKTLLDRLPSSWAAKLDSLRTGLTDARMGYLDRLNTYLDVAISTRAAAADYTAARAGYLDKLNVGGVPVVKGTQEGYLAVPTPSSSSGQDTKYRDIPISAVNVSKCVIELSGDVVAGSYYGADYLFRRLTSATNLRISTYRADATSFNVYWKITEYY